MGRMDSDLRSIAIMQEFGWSYEQYMNTPQHIITLIVEKMKRDRKKQELEAKRGGRG